MKVTVIAIVDGTLEKVSKGLKKTMGKLKIRRSTATIQTTVLLKSVEIQEESWTPEKICCHSDFNEKAPGKAGVKNFIYLLSLFTLGPG